MKKVVGIAIFLLVVYGFGSNSSDYSTNLDYKDYETKSDQDEYIESDPSESENSSYYENDSYYYEEPITSDNWICTDDCSGHEAGYAWAEENYIIDPADCGGNSNSFIEGCEAYANEYQMYENNEDEDYYEDDSYLGY